MYPPVSRPEHPVDIYDSTATEPWEEEGQSLDLREVLRVLRRNAWIVVLAVIVTTAATAWGSSKVTPRYRARATLRMEAQREALAGQIDRGYVDWMAWRTNPLVTESALLKENREVGGAVVDKLGLRLRVATPGLTWSDLADVSVDDDTEADSIRLHFTPERVAALAPDGRTEVPYGTPLSLDGVTLTVVGQPGVGDAVVRIIPRDRAVSTVLGPLSATPREQTNLIDLDYTSTDARLAQLVVNAVAEEFQAANFDRLRQISVQRRAFIEKQIQEEEALLNEAYRALADFRKDRQMYGDQETRQNNLLDLDVRREELVVDRDMAQSLIEEYPGPGQDTEEWVWSVISSPGISSDGILSGLYGELNGYRQQRQQMVAGEWGTWTDHPDVQRLDGLIADTEQKMVDALQHHVEGQNARIAGLDELRSRRRASLEDIASAEMQETWLSNEVETIRGIAQQLQVEYQRARISEAVETPQWAIMNAATSPGHPLGTRQRQTLLLGLLAGIVLGGGGAFLREHLDGSIRRREEIQTVLGVPGLAVIPRIDTPKNASEVKTHQLVASSDLLSGSAEAYRVLRTNLIFSHAVNRINTLLVTSPSAGEGKTTTAANLAVAAAQQQGLRVLLIDCDLRKARLHQIFDVPKQPGLTDFLIQANPLSEVVHSTSVPGLHLIPTGTFPPNPADLLGIERMSKLLDALKEKLDLIILDSPPVLAAADSMILSLQVDGTLMVARAGKTDRDTARQAMRQITSVGGRVVGVVLNDPDQKVKQYYYYNRYPSDHGEKSKRSGEKRRATTTA